MIGLKLQEFGMLRDGGVVAVTSIALEARIARGPGVTVLCEHSLRLRAALETAIARGASGVISFGVAGGLRPGLFAGDCVVASGVRAGEAVLPTDAAWARNLLAAIPGAVHAEIAGADAVVMTPAAKAQVHAATDAVAVDMESHIAAQVAAAHRIPFAACRIVIDAAHRALPPASLVGLREDGTTDVAAVLRSIVREPRQIPDLIRTALDARVAWRSLSAARQRIGASLGFPAYDESELALDLAVA
jgi:hopanoid-associated phosphorylase